MKKLRNFVLFALVLATLLTSLSACGKRDDGTIGKKPLEFNEVYRKDLIVSFDEGYTAVEDVPFTEIIDYCGCFVLYTENMEYCIYNVESDSVILRVDVHSVVDTRDIRLYDDFIQIISTNPETQAKTSSVYAENGSLLASVDGKHTVSATEDGFVLQQKFYYVEDSVIKKEYALPPFAVINKNYTFTNDFAIYVNDRTAIYYNEQFEIVASYRIPRFGVNHSMYLLDNNNLLIQYAQECDANSKKYDFIDDSIKYTLHTLLLDPEKGGTKDLNLKVFINSVENRTTEYSSTEPKFEDIYTDKVENVLTYYAIVDGLVDQGAMYSVLLSNEGKIGASLCYVENQTGPITPLNTGYYCAPTKEGYVILNGKGELIHTVPTIGTATDFGYATNSKIYDQNFKPLFDIPISPSSYTSICDTAVFYSQTIGKTTHYYRYDKNGEVEITPPENKVFYQNALSLKSGYYVVSAASTEYTNLRFYVYSPNGTLLLSSRYGIDAGYNAFSIYLITDNEMLVGYKDATTNEPVYKRLVKS